ncbi:MAG: hypothetical protein ABW221_25725 [Vicinamibacteria bacterium]
MAPASIDAPALAGAYRNLVLWFGGQLLVNALSCGARGLQGAAAVLVSLVVLVGMLATLVALVYYGYRTAQALGSTVAWLWAVGMLVPCVNVITLLALSSQATRACRENGIEVGLLGPKI